MTPEHIRLSQIAQVQVGNQVPSDDGDTEPTTWRWYVRLPEAPSVRARKKYDLARHLIDAKELAKKFVKRLQLTDELRQAIIVAVEFHDLGKHRRVWQKSIGNQKYPSEVWAKSGAIGRWGEMTRYRHEFGSLLDVQEQADFQSLSPEIQELVLHLIAAHHGRARPHFPGEEAFDLEPKGRDTEALAIDVPRRFAQLQRKYGRWGLAYLESLVRAADYAASAAADDHSGVNS